MKFNQIHRILILTFVLCSKIIRGDNSEANKWHIFSGYLYYIEVEQKYSALDAALYCKSIGLHTYFGIHAKFGEYLQSFYGYLPPLWGDGRPSSCKSYDLGLKNETEYLQEGCSKKMGFLCTIDISYGEIQFKNGTQLSIKRDDVSKYCDPQAGHAFDQQNCMIVLY